MVERWSDRQKGILIAGLALVNVIVLSILGLVVYTYLYRQQVVSPVSTSASPRPSSAVRLAFPPTWTVTPTSTPLPTRAATLTPTATSTPTSVPRPTPTLDLPLLTLAVPVTDLDAQDRRERIHIIEAAVNDYRGNVPAPVLLAMAALESQGTFSNLVADHGVMGVTTKAGNCFTLIYENTERDLRQNVADAVCHLSGYAWERASLNDRNTVLIKTALKNAGYSDYVGQVVTAVHWYAGETQPDYLYVVAEIMDGNADAARNVPLTFGEQYRNRLLAQAFRVGYYALVGSP